MSPFKPVNARLGRAGLVFAALISIAVVTPSLADDDTFEQRYPKRYLNEYPNYNRHHHRHRHHDDDGFFSFGLGGGPVYAPPPQYYYPPPAYYPQPHYYQPGPSFNLTIPFGD